MIQFCVVRFLRQKKRLKVLLKLSYLNRVFDPDLINLIVMEMEPVADQHLDNVSEEDSDDDDMSDEESSGIGFGPSSFLPKGMTSFFDSLLFITSRSQSYKTENRSVIYHYTKKFTELRKITNMFYKRSLIIK